jgi:hypothetical protein
VDPQTRYQMQEAVGQFAVASGRCLSASGPLGPNGAMQAVRITLVPPVKDLCPGA